MSKCWLGTQVAIITVYDRDLALEGHIECVPVEFGFEYYVDNWLARKFDIDPHQWFESPEQILEIINGG